MQTCPAAGLVIFLSFCCPKEHQICCNFGTILLTFLDLFLASRRPRYCLPFFCPKGTNCHFRTILLPFFFDNLLAISDGIFVFTSFSGQRCTVDSILVFVSLPVGTRLICLVTLTHLTTNTPSCNLTASSPQPKPNHVGPHHDCSISPTPPVHSRTALCSSAA